MQIVLYKQKHLFYLCNFRNFGLCFIRKIWPINIFVCLFVCFLPNENILLFYLSKSSLNKPCRNLSAPPPRSKKVACLSPGQGLPVLYLCSFKVLPPIILTCTSGWLNCPQVCVRAPMSCLSPCDPVMDRCPVVHRLLTKDGHWCPVMKDYQLTTISTVCFVV